MLWRIWAPPQSTRAVMQSVWIALIPGTLTSVWIFGPGVLVHLVLAGLGACLAEVIGRRARGLAAMQALQDGSTLLTAWLLALALPPAAPLWLPFVAGLIAIGLGKQLYGGLGQNPVNPAMLAYAILIVSAPVAMTTGWIVPFQGWSTPIPLTGIGVGAVDGLTGATILDLYRTEFRELTAPEIAQHPLFSVGGLGIAPGVEWVALSHLLGGGFLFARRVIRWQAPVGFLVGLLGLAAFFAIDPDNTVPVLTHALAGATLFSAFFIVTDPVSGATSPRGQWWFGLGAGVITYLIRTYGLYPDGVAFAVLFMNFMVPLIDQYTRPRIHGESRSIRGSVRGRS
ncbi:MAG: RnfABCDGE type electron transport complex subunit D [Litorivicinaceae bacterium]|jgi:Na+-translocating ferredoxin:NAD+ oxidoreductase subunit D|nr:RnfABCDGE type electron transport complex subunit D [Litorivicinaceae bacterium]MDP5328308.1 RnfABCDGE type electron transport complex subunit D [Litorivicinaceae bacterium]MDP5329935.1 RnfABCDGE type electron transport complex subunit D [Litorivicinaceae bacterium]MDP5341578.1 RnfABCDGE type electron transport complex subunit D [Litorivicinaceae bacterium]MDP5363307.1 RnfABCDGE type electron transport complex subunit D [Litorivicinaceae bacterium]